MDNEYQQPRNETSADEAAQNTPIVPVGEGFGPSQMNLLEATHQLTNMTRSFEGFFQMQMERLRHGLQVCRQRKSEADVVRRLLADFENQRQEWDTQCDREVQRLTRANEELAEAWRQLEDQQRQLQIDNSRQQNPPQRPQQPRAAYATVGESAAVETSIFDFQQLQRQVREHAQRSR